MGEVVARHFEDETEAETAAGYLRSVGLEARVRYCATMGVPRPMAPIRVVAPLGDYELVVPEGEQVDARQALSDVGRPSQRPRRYRWLGLALVLVWLLPLVISAIVALHGAFGP